MSADPLHISNNNANDNTKFNPLPLPNTNNPKPTRLPLLSVYFQAFAYYDSILTAIAFPFQLLIFIYKYNILYYESSNSELYNND